ncbi:MAG: hypothetical protein WD830_03405 [Chloroflexota bacterium]
MSEAISARRVRHAAYGRWWLIALGLLIAAPAPVRAVDVNSLALKATYDVKATFGWSNRRVSVDSTAKVTNTSNGSVSVIAFNLATLRTGNARIGNVTANGTAANARVEDQTVLVNLPSPLTVGNQILIRIRYTAVLSSSPNANGYTPGFARANGVMTAYRWIPWLSRTTRFSNTAGGEPWVTPVSPSVRVELTTDQRLIFATSGRRVAVNGLKQTFVATNVRDFNLSASPTYRSASTTVNGTRITFLYRTLPKRKVLNLAVRAFRNYSANVGAYPHPQVTISEVGPWYAMESPSLIWLPSNASRGQLPWMVSHELAHQWFYSTVGNDQARQPFADEALADFMARNLLSRWATSKCAPDDLDQTIYELGGCYAWVIYVQGGNWLRAYRNKVGDRTFWRGLANYYSNYRYRIGGTRQALDALDAAAGIKGGHEDRFPGLYP